MLPSEQWEELCIGDGLQNTMYIDLVSRKFAPSSISTERYDLMDDIKDMFSLVNGI
jgi:hypothetical protein